MKTEDLIDKAKVISRLNRNNDRDVTADVIDALVNRLELAYKDLNNYSKCELNCITCVQFREGDCDGIYRWRGDEEC